jgi:LuxR family maltose regulon positive regulatory protein
LERTNLFLIPLDDRREWYRYHQLFADFLRTELEPEEDMQAQRAAAQWYQEQGFLREAIKHWLAAGEAAGAADLINLMSVEVLQTGELTTLLGWLDALPDDLVVCRDSRLGPLKALCLFVTGRNEEGAAIVRRIQDCLRSEADPVSLGRLRMMQAYMTRLNPEQAAAYTREAVDLLGDDDPPFSTMALIFMGNQQTATSPTEAIDTFHRVVQIARSQHDVFVDVVALSDLLAILDMMGRRQEAADLASECIAHYADEQGEPLPATGVTLAHVGALAYVTDDLRAAEQAARKGVALCRQLGVPVGIALGLRWRAMIHYAWGQHSQAFDSIREARRLAIEARNETLICQCVSTEADFLLRQGRISEARRKANRLPSLTWPPENPYHVPAQLIAIRLLLAQGELQEAQSLLVGMREWAGRLGFVGHLIPILIQQAHLALNYDDVDGAITALAQAVDLAAPEEYRRPFLDADDAILTLLPDAHHAAPAFVDSLLSASERAEAPQLLADPLTEREIEVLRLIADGLTNQEIADQLVVAVSTIKTHINRIYGKLDVRHRAEALARARELNLLP